MTQAEVRHAEHARWELEAVRRERDTLAFWLALVVHSVLTGTPLPEPFLRQARAALAEARGEKVAPPSLEGGG